mmetsp:Transcript_40179/g.104030  ORF Transcript_40179/g.104030 Transcript_40179/m.104030 type:complete len:440 (-) Transcript_40179:78-1397(-)
MKVDARPTEETIHHMPIESGAASHTLHRLGDEAVADGPAALTHGEAHALLDGRAGDELALHVDVIARHSHLHLLAAGVGHAHHLACDVASPEVEHGHVAGHHGVAAATLLLLGQVHVGLELGVGLRGARSADHLAAHDTALVDTAEQNAHGVTGRALGEVSVEHLDACDGRLQRLLATAQDLDIIALLHDTLLHAASGHGAAARDGEDVLDRQQERLVRRTRRHVHVRVHDLHELQDLVHPLVVALLGVGVGLHGLQGLQGRAQDERRVVAREAVLAQQLARLQLHQLQQLLVVHDINLVHEAHQLRHAHLLAQQNVLPRLGHRAIGRGDHQDAAVHLASTRDHVLDVVRVAGAIHVAIVPGLCLVLDVRGVDRDTAGALLRGVVNILVGLLLGVVGRAELPAHNGDSCGERRLAVVDVADGAQVHVVLDRPGGMAHHG